MAIWATSIPHLDSKEDMVGIPADRIWETVAALDLIKQNNTKPHEPLKLFVQLRDTRRHDEEHRRPLERVDW